MGRSHALLEYALAGRLTRELGANTSVTFTDNRKTMISVTRQRGKSCVRLSRLFALADEPVLREVIAFLSGKSPTLAGAARAFINRVPAGAPPGKVKTRSRGRHYHLGGIARKLNRRYFDGALAVKITWGKAPARRPGARRRRSIQYGSFDESLNLIRIHPVLDSAFVPPLFIELVVYHEMLHKKLGVYGSRAARRALHGREFLKLERAFEGYPEAMAWEKQHLDGLLARAVKLGNGGR
ncbi:MAG: hypothetical protein HY804_08575 [Nitrospinae bacterium]|nr:hypothetical protein [Nitrospinota bacterium]